MELCSTSSDRFRLNREIERFISKNKPFNLAKFYACQDDHTEWLRWGADSASEIRARNLQAQLPRGSRDPDQTVHTAAWLLEELLHVANDSAAYSSLMNIFCDQLSLYGSE